MNEKITAKEVRLISVDGEQLGIVPMEEALERAQEDGLDLMEVSPNADPPVCRILNFEKIGTTALVLQSATPSAISTVLLAEAYKKQRELAAEILLKTTIISIATIPLLFLLINH